MDVRLNDPGGGTAAAIRDAWWTDFWSDPGIVSVGFGLRTVAGRPTGDPAIVVGVMKKISKARLPPSRLLPRRIAAGGDAIEVDVVEVGPIRPFGFTRRMPRPLEHGVGISHWHQTPGTLGCLVRDESDGSCCILGAGHAFAPHGWTVGGDPIIQPSAFQGGTRKNDTVALLKRYEAVDSDRVNELDCAIAEVIDPSLVADRIVHDLMPVPTPDHPAVGVLFAGGKTEKTYLNPMSTVLKALHIDLWSGEGAHAAPWVGMPVEKVGAATGYTRGVVTEIDCCVRLTHRWAPLVFVNQIATSLRSGPGDSGAVVCRAPEGHVHRASAAVARALRTARAHLWVSTA